MGRPRSSRAEGVRVFGMGWGELVALAVLGLLLFGPDRLPAVARDAGRTLRALRELTAKAREELRDTVGPEIADLDLRKMSPRAVVGDALFGDPPAAAAAVAPVRRVQVLPLGERPPYDPDLT